MGTLQESEIPRLSIASGADNSLHILERMIDAAGMAGMTKEQLPNMRQILASNAVGRSGGDLSLCESLFPECRISVTDLVNEALEVAQQVTDAAINPPTTGIIASLLQPPTEDSEDTSARRRKGRSLCDGAGSLCPGIVIGCSLCGMFSPGVCDDTCIVAGLYCGTTGYACAMGTSDDVSDENEEADNNENEEASSDDEVTTQEPADAEAGSEVEPEGETATEAAAETDNANKIPK